MPIKKEKKHGLLSKTIAISSLGMSRLIENTVTSSLQSLTAHTYNFSDLHSFELLEDNSTVTSGGAGLALAATALTGNYIAGAIGGIVGKKKTKKIIEMLSIKLNINDFKNPCIIIPLITKKTKTDSNEYKNAYNKAQKIIAMLDLITHTS